MKELWIMVNERIRSLEDRISNSKENIKSDGLIFIFFGVMGLLLSLISSSRYLVHFKGIIQKIALSCRFLGSITAVPIFINLTSLLVLLKQKKQYDKIESAINEFVSVEDREDKTNKLFISDEPPDEVTKEKLDLLKKMIAYYTDYRIRVEFVNYVYDFTISEFVMLKLNLTAETIKNNADVIQVFEEIVRQDRERANNYSKRIKRQSQ